jgi:hypothetical protein
LALSFTTEIKSWKAIIIWNHVFIGLPNQWRAIQKRVTTEWCSIYNWFQTPIAYPLDVSSDSFIKPQIADQVLGYFKTSTT